MKVCIILPCQQVDKKTEKCIKGCLRQDYPEIELIVLPDHTDRRSTGKVRYVGTGCMGIAGKRNMGIEMSKNVDIFAFIDADASPEKDWITNAVGCIKDLDKDVWAVGGPNLSPKREGLRSKVVGNAHRSFLVSGFNSYRKTNSKSRYCTVLPTCNLFVKKETMDAIGGFDESLFTGEDINFCNRIIRAGKKIYFSNKVVVYHSNRRLFGEFARQRIIYGMSVFKILEKDTNLQNLSYLIPLAFTGGIGCMAILSYFFPSVGVALGALLAIYILTSVVEAVRFSSQMDEVLLTLVAILVGNLFPGLGSWAALLNLPIDKARLYRT